jgi:hypothetical protein
MPGIGRILSVLAVLGATTLSIGLLGAPGLAHAAPAEDLDVQVVDDRVSIRATAVPLEELMAMLDRAAGTESVVAPELAGRNVSVHFDGLFLGDAVEKIFEGQNLDYIVVGGRRIRVTAVSGVVSASTTPAAAVVTTAAPPVANPFQSPQVQPPVVQTPFGPMVNPRAQGQGGNQDNVAPNPLSMPGQAGSPFGSQGTNTDASQGLFGNTSPPIMDLNKQQTETQPTFPGNSPVPTSPGAGTPVFPNGVPQTSPGAGQTTPTSPFPTSQP